MGRSCRGVEVERVDGLRLYLLGGLVLHKLVWEVLKRRQPERVRPAESESLLARAAKLVKLGILFGILAQTLLSDVLPIRPDPGALRFAGAALFTAGLAIAIIARLQLGRNWSDIEAGLVKPDHELVARGLYRYIRHPIYAGDLLLLFGLELALNSWLVLGVFALAAVVYRQTLREERVLLERLPGYAGYCARTRRFIPFVL
jgi:protein-S-isoprenylcysteine O-methyltransferase Ste14